MFMFTVLSYVLQCEMLESPNHILCLSAYGVRCILYYNSVILKYTNGQVVVSLQDLLLFYTVHCKFRIQYSGLNLQKVAAHSDVRNACFA